MPVTTTLDVLRDMHASHFCSTDLCSGPSFGLVVKRGVVWATSYCPCGSTDQSYPVPMSDLLSTLEVALVALFGRCYQCGEPAHEDSEEAQA